MIKNKGDWQALVAPSKHKRNHKKRVWCKTAGVKPEWPKHKHTHKKFNPKFWSLCLCLRWSLRWARFHSEIRLLVLQAAQPMHALLMGFLWRALPQETHHKRRAFYSFLRSNGWAACALSLEKTRAFQTLEIHWKFVLVLEISNEFPIIFQRLKNALVPGNHMQEAGQIPCIKQTLIRPVASMRRAEAVASVNKTSLNLFIF